MSRIRKTIVFVALSSAVLIVAGEAAAQTGQGQQQRFRRYGFAGFGFGYNYVFTDLDFRDGPDDPYATSINQHGFAWTLYGGVRLHPHVSAEAAWDINLHNFAQGYYHSYMILDGFRAGVRFHLPNRSPLEPFLAFGIGFYWAGERWYAERFAFGFTAGGGITVLARRDISIEILALYRGWVFGTMHYYSCGHDVCPYGESYVHSFSIMGALRWNSPIF